MHISGHEHMSHVVRHPMSPRSVFLVAGATSDDRHSEAFVDPKMGGLVWYDTRHFPTVLNLHVTSDKLEFEFFDIAQESVLYRAAITAN